MRTLLLLFPILAQSYSSHSYQCVAYLDEKRNYVTINLDQRQAKFYEFESTTTLHVVDAYGTPSTPEESIVLFQGVSKNFPGHLRLEFNWTKETISFYHVRPNESYSRLGVGPCTAI